jgi:hypothetical protein
MVETKAKARWIASRRDGQTDSSDWGGEVAKKSRGKNETCIGLLRIL